MPVFHLNAPPSSRSAATAIRRIAALTSVGCALAAGLYSPAAQACGGTFCDAGPTAMPVDQSGENVIFVMEPGSVEAHIQIQYDPDTSAEKFAWVIPVQSLPEFSVGSELFFDAVLNATVPRYGVGDSFDSCGGDTGDSGSESSSSESTGTSTGGDEGGDGGGPSVVFEETVGAFDITVLQGGTIEELMTWLADNGYQQDPAAMPILGEYLDEGFLFAAMKLTHDAGTDTIHPITLKMDTDEACVPLRLTAIAATQDMDVRTFFFGHERVVPTNYRHVEVNPLKIDWVNFASNYKEVVTLAVDADGADGNAFVTEFAGDNANVPTFNIYQAPWAAVPGNVTGLVDSPVGAIDALKNANLFWCDLDWDIECYANHPLLDGLLAQYIPLPEGLTRAEFYDCLSCYEGFIDLEAWDAQAFADAIRDRIVLPGQRARQIVETYPYVTRMYTTISDVEMNVDPIFRPNPDLDPVLSQRIGQRRNHCDGSATMTLPDGREVYMPNANQWPDIAPEAMPWEERIARGTMMGSMVEVANQTAKIDELLEDWNAGRPGGAEGGPGFDMGGDGLPGCGCTSSPEGGGGLALGLLTLVGLHRRRRRA